MFCLGLVFVTAPAYGQRPKYSKLMTTDLAEVDADFAYQGEYMGYISAQAGAKPTRKLGVQVVARGNGTFDVVTFEGGLPGDGWNGEDQERAWHAAQLTDGRLPVQASGLSLSIGDNMVQVFNEEGSSLGQLRKFDRISPTMGRPAPKNAVVLFDGKENDLWKNMKVTEDGLLQEGCETINPYGDFHLHLEFLLPYKPEGKGQDRGNSGVYMQRRYEIQILDSFGEPGLANECGGVYTLIPPDLNMTLPPLTWQTYDIDFRGARFDEEENKVENMRLRVWHNGVLIHNDIEVPSKTGAGRPEGPNPLPILLQDHSNPVLFRNIWLVEGDSFETPVPVRAQMASTPTHPPGTAPAATAAVHGHGPAYGMDPAGPVYGRGYGRGHWWYGYGYNVYTPWHNYGPLPGQPVQYWYSSSFVDLPAYPYVNVRRW